MIDNEKPIDPYLLNFDSHGDTRGSLFALDLKNVPFIAKRYFSITVNNLAVIRGQHAHKKCWQLLIPDQYGFSVEIRNSNSILEFNPTFGQGLVIPPGNWCAIIFKSTNSTIQVFASQEYDAADYIVEPPR